MLSSNMNLEKPNRNAWLWWMSVVSLSIGLAIFILLQPVGQDYAIQRIRSIALIAALMIVGLCIIIGTQRRWFGKNL